MAHLQSPEAPEAKADDAQTQPEVADPDPGVDLQMERPAEAVSTTFDGSIDL